MFPYSILDRYWTYLPGQQVVLDGWHTTSVEEVRGKDIVLHGGRKVSVDRVTPEYSHKVTLKSGFSDAFRAWMSDIEAAEFRFVISDFVFGSRGDKPFNTLEGALLSDMTYLVSARRAWLPWEGCQPLMQRLGVHANLYYFNSELGTPNVPNLLRNLTSDVFLEETEPERALGDMAREVRWVEFLLINTPLWKKQDIDINLVGLLENLL